MIIQDADLEYDPGDYPVLLRPIQTGKARVVYGSRFIGEHRAMYFWHSLGNKFLTLLCNALFDTTLTDMETCYKVFTIDVARQLKLREPRWGFDPEITARLLKMGNRIYEVPVSYAGREFNEDFLSALPDHVDPCGERGEFHTFAFDGPMFSKPVNIEVGEITEREGFVYADVLPASSAPAARANAGV